MGMFAKGDWEVVSQMARDMLLGALVTTAGLWSIGITLAICYVVFSVQGGGLGFRVG
jgi:hypothetical protein